MISDLLWFLLTVLFYGLIIGYVLILIPAMLCVGLRRQWVYFAAGFVTLGFAWVIGCFQSPGIPKRVVLGVVSAIVLIGVFSARPAVFVGVDGESLQNSVGGIVSFSDSCRKAGEDWLCWKYDDSISGDRGYKVEVDWTGCWQGRVQRHVNEPMDAISDPTVDGCVTLVDLVFDF